MYFTYFYVIACVCVLLTFGSISTEEYNVYNSDSEPSVVNNSSQTNEFNNWTEENEFINSIEINRSLYNFTDVKNFTDNFQLINSSNLSSSNEYIQQIDVTKPENSELTNFTETSDVFKDLQSYNSSDLSDFIDRFQMPIFIESRLQPKNFTEKFQLTNSSHINMLENGTKAQKLDLENLDNATLFTYDKHIIAKRESDASFQRELDDFDAEVFFNETLKNQQDSPSTESLQKHDTNPELKDESSTITDIETTTEELATTEECTVYPYTSEDGLIDVVADNGIKYISSESDNFPRSGEETENLARITDDSEPMHYVISGESNLSQDSRKEIGIEDLLPDYVKPTVSGESEKNEIVSKEKSVSSDEIVLSESEEEPSTTTTTEPVTWLVNSREYKGENYESKEETKPDNLTRSINQTELEEDTSVNMEYRDEEENQIPKNVNMNTSNNNVKSYSTSTLPAKYYAGQSSTLQTDDQEEKSDTENITSAEKESYEDSEYNPWGSVQRSQEENKSVIENSINSDETNKKDDQFELIEMSFDSSSDNSTNFSLESDQIANQNFTFQNIELSSSESYDDAKKSNNDVSDEDYDVDNIQIINTNNGNLTYRNSNDVITDSNKGRGNEKRDNQTSYSKIQSNTTTVGIHLENSKIKNENETESNSTKIIKQTTIKKNQHNGKNKHLNKINYLNSTKEEQEKTKSTTTPKEREIYKFDKSYKNVRHKRGIFKNVVGKDMQGILRNKRNVLEKGRNMSQVEHTTPYHWPQNSRENHGDLYETQEENDTAKSEDFDYFRASGHYSDYDEYSGKDISIHVVEKNTSHGVKIFITKKNTSHADVQKDYEDFVKEFKVNSTTEPVQSGKQSNEQANKRYRRDIEDKLLEKYKRFQKQQSQPNQNFCKIPPTQIDLEKMLSKLFMHKLRNSLRKTIYVGKAKSKIIFKKDDSEVNVNGKPLELQSPHGKSIKSKQEIKNKGKYKISHKIKTNFKEGLYKWSKKLNRLKKIDR